VAEDSSVFKALGNLRALSKERQLLERASNLSIPHAMVSLPRLHCTLWALAENDHFMIFHPAATWKHFPQSTHAAL
jgi:hypothetical protein